MVKHKKVWPKPSKVPILTVRITVSFRRRSTIEFFTVNTKLVEMVVLASKDLTTAKKVTASGAPPDARDYNWSRSSMPNRLS